MQQWAKIKTNHLYLLGNLIAFWAVYSRSTFLDSCIWTGLCIFLSEIFNIQQINSFRHHSHLKESVEVGKCILSGKTVELIKQSSSWLISKFISTTVCFMRSVLILSACNEVSFKMIKQYSLFGWANSGLAFYLKWNKVCRLLIWAEDKPWHSATAISKQRFCSETIVFCYLICKEIHKYHSSIEFSLFTLFFSSDLWFILKKSSLCNKGKLLFATTRTHTHTYIQLTWKLPISIWSCFIVFLFRASGKFMVNYFLDDHILFFMYRGYYYITSIL